MTDQSDSSPLGEKDERLPMSNRFRSFLPVVVDVETGREPTERELADPFVEHRLDSSCEDVLSPMSVPHRDEGSDAHLAAGDQYAGRGNAARSHTGASKARQSSIGWASRSEIAYTTAGLKPSP